MPRYVVAPQRKGTYVVLEPFRFNGRNFETDMEFDARRLDVPRGRLDGLYREAFIGLPDEDEDFEEREVQEVAIDEWQPPQQVLEPLPDEDEDFEE